MLARSYAFSRPARIEEPNARPTGSFVPWRSAGERGEGADWRRAGLCLLVFASVYLIFALFPSVQRNADGPLQDIERVTEGRVDPSARHTLYTLVGVPYYQLWRSLGYDGDAARPLQLLNAFCAALGAAGLFLVSSLLTTEPFVALLATWFYAFSYGYWFFSADVFYNVFTIVPVIWSLPLLFVAVSSARQSDRILAAAGLAILGAIAVLGSQEHLLFAVVVFSTLAAGPVQVARRFRVAPSLVYALGLAVLLLSAYAALASSVAGCQSLRCVASWLRPYGTLLPMYQQFSWERVPQAVWSFLASVVPLWRGMALRDLARGVLVPEKLVPQAALLAVVLGLFLTAGVLLAYRQRLVQRHRLVCWIALVWALAYVPAIVWMDPFGPERWIVPLIPVLLLVTVGADLMLTGGGRSRRVLLFSFAASALLLVFAANLSQAIWPDHDRPNPDILAARFAAARMTAKDVMVSPVWDWTLYLPAEGRRTLNIPDLSTHVTGREPDAETLLASLDAMMAATRAAGGRVFLVDVFSYDAAEWEWITGNTGLREAHFARYEVQPAWRYEGMRVWSATLKTN